jgi:hypothetical protein
LRKIRARTRQETIEYEFSHSKQRFPYDWKKAVLKSHGLDSLNIGKAGIQVLSNKNNDPFVVFKQISQNAISEPILHIRLESNREGLIQLYYQTTHMPKFNRSQRITYQITKGGNSIYFKIPEKDFIGPFRIDTDKKQSSEVIIQNIELRH